MSSASEVGSEYQIHFLDVGQGNSTVVILPIREAGKREALVIDSADGPATIACLRKCGVTHLRFVLITHSDADHAQGIPAVLTEYQGRTTALAYNVDRASLGRRPVWESVLLKRIVGKDVEHVYNADTHLDDTAVGLLSNKGKKFAEILWPQTRDTHVAFHRGKPNQASAVLSFWIDNFRVLLGSDLSLDGWNKLCERLGPSKVEKLRANVFQFPHHGAELDSAQAESADAGSVSNALNGLELLRLIRPEIVLISVGTQQPPNYQHPRSTTFDLLKAYRQECNQRGERVRLLCTELTARCHADPLAMRSDALGWQQEQGRDTSFAKASDRACPCCGTVSLFIPTDGTKYRCEPGMEHNRFVDRVKLAGGSPRCRLT